MKLFPFVDTFHSILISVTQVTCKTFFEISFEYVEFSFFCDISKEMCHIACYIKSYLCF